MDIGKELKRIRVSQGMTLEELSNKCGYSKALISRVETGSVSPSLTSLMKMVSSLGLKLHDLFTSIERGQASVVHKGEGRKFFTEDKSTTEFLASNIATKKMEPIKVTLPGGYASADEPLAHYGEQFVYVLNGKIELTANDETYKLGTGDSMYLPAGTPHKWRNISKEGAELISVVTPPQI
ncbi:MAG: cupin domain-containing protein [Candidatus Abyssobacteria bacterium SURF_17]|jgi:quercetin dioxygenase-like cupin family protein/DNA-binding XRE family transcriptional regulator|uniref:Cupin domain-containing protein n=1 Tax=Candidatus Abyssobacteria bacterium SURF_17 TaxID=2093361 RepID=A0A419F957_9BACT|nr:MAG: cupin domain-containing protein [Candidatus Abyssubacteria bacterium SURF_17]